MKLDLDLESLLPFESGSPEETVAFGKSLAAKLVPGHVLALFGDLGTGKTHLAKGLCAGLGVDPVRVKSPTFTLVNEYRGRDFPVFHIDAYRIKSEEELVEMGIEEYLFGGGVCIVEWAERLLNLLPANAIPIELKHTPSGGRLLSVAAGVSP